MDPKRILVVDDEDDIREVAAFALQAVGGWQVLTAASGRQALALAAAHRPDAILLDVMMPELDGPATVVALRDDPATRNIPVVLLTAKVQAADRQRFSQLAISGVLSKPFDPMALPGQLRDALATTA
ncbi:MAG: response regulator [Chloroflexota bacterium]|nr:response regulator [Chloroflexota bacterium]